MQSAFKEVADMEAPTPADLAPKVFWATWPFYVGCGVAIVGVIVTLIVFILYLFSRRKSIVE